MKSLIELVKNVQLQGPKINMVSRNYKLYFKTSKQNYSDYRNNCEDSDCNDCDCIKGDCDCFDCQYNC